MVLSFRIHQHVSIMKLFLLNHTCRFSSLLLNSSMAVEKWDIWSLLKDTDYNMAKIFEFELYNSAWTFSMILCVRWTVKTDIGSSSLCSELLTRLLSPIAEVWFFPPSALQLGPYCPRGFKIRNDLFLSPWNFSWKYFRQLPPHLIPGD